MAWAYLSRIFSFSRDGSDGLGHSSSQSDAESPQASAPSITSSTPADIVEAPNEPPESILAEAPPTLLPSVRSPTPNDIIETPNEPPESVFVESPPAPLPPITSSIPNNIVETPNNSPESILAESPPASVPSIISSTPTDIIEIPNEHPESILAESPVASIASSILNDIIETPNEPADSILAEAPAASLPSITSSTHNDIVEVPDESPESIFGESPPAFLPSVASSSIEHVPSSRPNAQLPLATPPSGTSSNSEQVPAAEQSRNDLFETPYEPKFNISELSLLMQSASEPGNKSARKQITAFFTKTIETLVGKRSPEEEHVLNHWDNTSLRVRSSSSTLPLLPLPQSSSLSLSFPKIFVDASPSGIGFIFNDRWLAWTFTPNHPDIVLGPDNNIIMHWAELIAVELGILTLLELGYRNMEVLVKSDNEGVVLALERKKWTPKHGLDAILSRILQMCEKASLELKAKWVSTKDNLADGPSRGQYPPADMMLECGPTIPQYLEGLLNQGGMVTSIHSIPCQ